jgi:hypothetical protein
MHIICGNNGQIVHFSGLNVRGHRVTLYACFPDEQQALDVAFHLEDQGLLPHSCKVVGCESVMIEESK